MKIQLKRSNVLSSGAAKVPTAAQLEYGELAVNYNNSDPAIFLKDSNNNVIRISGVGNISDDGLTNVPDGTTPPANPEAGNLWYNSDQGRLYIYFEDADTSQWVDASPDSWDPSSYPDVANTSAQANTLDDRYAMVNGGNSFTGNVGIGASSPSTKLNIKSNASDDGILLEKNDGTDVARLFYDASSSDARLDMFSGGVAKIQLKANGDSHFSGGKVGIGTTSPNTKLHVVETGAFSAITASSNVSTTGLASRFALGNSISTARFTINMKGGGGEEAYLGSEGNFPIYFQTHGTERMRIDSSGRVGINTGSTTLGGIFQVRTASDKNIAFNTLNGESRISSFNDAVSASNPLLINGSDLRFLSGSASAERMRIDSAGRVGIGTASLNSASQLHVLGSNYNPIVVDSSNSGGAGVLFHQNGTAALYAGTGGSSWLTGSATTDGLIRANQNLLFATSGNNERMRITNSGNVGIGVTNPITKLEIDGGSSTATNLYIKSSLSSTYLRFANNVNTLGYVGYESDQLAFYTNNLPRLQMRNNGDVILGPYRAPGTFGTVSQNVPYSIKVAPYGWSNGSEIAAISMGAHGGTGQDDGEIVFKTASNVHSNTNALQERVRILSTGGLTFNGDTAQTNALDDYEEGTCSITLYQHSTNNVNPAQNTTAYYTKVGNIVNVTYYSSIITVNYGGNSEIDGLPFVAKNVSQHYPPAVFTHTTCFTTDIQNGYMNTNTNNLYPIQRASTNQAQWSTGGQFKYLMFNITYKTN